MNRIACFTSINFAYLNRARILATSLKRFHPDWTMIVCITDRPSPGFDFDLAKEPFDEAIWAEDLPIENIHAWLFKHDVVEVCTAVKGPVLKLLCSSGAEKVFYLDPDIAVFSPLTSLVEELDSSDILLTPHQLTPDVEYTAILDNEICSLQHGIYNLGFVAINTKGDGKRFANWWNDRLMSFCCADLPNGLFVDQRWCDLAPAFFEKLKIIRDPGCNVASWNLSTREISSSDDGSVLVNGQPLKFYHFTKIDTVGLTMTEKYAKDNLNVYELIGWYQHQLDLNTSHQINPSWWHYGTYHSGEKIKKSHRVLYRNRRDLQEAFPEPHSDQKNSYLTWLKIHNEF